MRLTAPGARWLDHEENEEVTLTIRARDFSDATLTSTAFDAISATNRGRGVDIDEVTFDIDDVNEAPEYKGYMAANTDYSSTLEGRDTATSPVIFTVDQREDGNDGRSNNGYIYLNLTRMFEDPEDMDNYGDGGFRVDVSAGAPWLTLLPVNNSDLGGMRTGPQRWGEIEVTTGQVDIGTGTNLTWGANSPGGDTPPAANDIVVILRVDRDSNEGGGSVRQDENGMIAITATDGDGASDTTNIRVRVDDQNLLAPTTVGTVVTVTGPARQGSTLDMTFNQQLDPDFTGNAANPNNPILVRYQWVYDPGGANNAVRQETTSNEDYTLMPGDVGDTVLGRVIYYELFDGEIFQSVMFNDSASGSGPVDNRPDEGSATFTFMTNSSDLLVLTPVTQGPGRFMDGDLAPIGTVATFSYSWEWSLNGTTWNPFGTPTTSTVTTTSTAVAAPVSRTLDVPVAQQGDYVRLVVTYEDAGGSNRIESQAVKVGIIDHVDVGASEDELHIDTSAGTAPPAGAVPAGWTLQIDGFDDVPGGSSMVEWLIGGRVVGEGREYTVSASDRGTISATVTRYDADGNLVSKATVPLPSGVTLTPNAAPVLAQAEPHYVDLGKAPDANGKYAMLEGMIDLQALFTDPEGGPVAGFAVSAPTTGGFGGTDAIPDTIRGNPLDLWLDLGGGNGAGAEGVANGGSEGDQILLINERTGEVEYHSTQAQVDGVATGDAGGNMISVTVTGADGGGFGARSSLLRRRQPPHRRGTDRVFIVRRKILQQLIQVPTTTSVIRVRTLTTAPQ